MRHPLKKISSRLMRGIRIYALVCVVASMASVSAGEMLLNDAMATRSFCVGGENDTFTCSSPGECPGGACVPVPEIPLAMLPVFLLMSAGSFYYIRRRNLKHTA